MKVTKLLKGNHALGEGAISGGCRHFFGYPITPQNELMEHLAERMPEAGGCFVQAESEVAAINMVIGAAGAGARVMSGSAGPGWDLFHEGIGNIHAHDFPVVLADIMRGGPGNGALHPSQQDYEVCMKARGDMKNIVLAPWSAQEMYDAGILAFELSDKYRNPVVVMADNVIGQSYGAVEIDLDYVPKTFDKPWAITGQANRAHRNLSIAHFPEVDGYNKMHEYKQQKYNTIKANEQRSDVFFTDDAELVVVAYGIMARNSLAAVKRLRNEGVKVGLFRPYTLFPYPMDTLLEVTKNTKVLVVEMSAGQMAADIKDQGFDRPFTLKPGIAVGAVPSPNQIYTWIKELL